MAFRIATELVERIVAEAAASPKVEVCGLLLGNGETVADARACRNVALDRSSRFEIDPAALLSAYRQARKGGPAVVGCYHSHPSGRAEPSACDAAMAEPNGWLWVIVAGKEVRGWRAVEGGSRFDRFHEVDLSSGRAAECNAMASSASP